ncbi:MAG: hypothetical protein GWM90_01860 [Gemmatimonadetes bacterium]|nr:hypothetical protein [Gemmatimonadota bacterium]NIQ52348.1 hypothetical protein [Gemmatimonadota bacterium]NIU72459.1 hypothetical protein [Gammaproteobacteria bacterium]NIX42916.1 hypothetical protein [Gemmatimonadota bacterium]NIY07803.1 hypothetical protein [Gemmatimonadota bacterium]
MDDSGPAVIAPDIIEIAMEGELDLLHPHAAENVDALDPELASVELPYTETTDEEESDAVALEDILLEDPDAGALEEAGAGEPQTADEGTDSGDVEPEAVPVVTDRGAREDGDGDEPVEQYPRPRQAPGTEAADLDERIDISLIGNWPPPPPSGGKRRRRNDRREAS